MTAEQIDELARLGRAVDHVRAQNRRNLDAAVSAYGEARRRCDHRNPDGSSALEGGLFMVSCRICGENDM